MQRRNLYILLAVLGCLALLMLALPLLGVLIFFSKDILRAIAG